MSASKYTGGRAAASATKGLEVERERQARGLGESEDRRTLEALSGLGGGQ
jgi:hypothetical protein